MGGRRDGVEHEPEESKLDNYPVTLQSVQSLSHVQLFVTPWTVAHQAPLSVGFSRQEYWRELPFPSPRDLPNSGFAPESFAFQENSLPSEPPRKPKGSLKKYQRIGNRSVQLLSCV